MGAARAGLAPQDPGHTLTATHGRKAMNKKWNSEQVPDQRGRTAIVTGANSGLGLATACELARHGASVVMACRDLAKGARAKQELEAQVPDARVELAGLDL